MNQDMILDTDQHAVQDVSLDMYEDVIQEMDEDMNKGSEYGHEL